MSQSSSAPHSSDPRRSGAVDDFLARFYRQMGLYAVAAALNVAVDPAAPAREERAAAPGDDRKAA